MIGTVRATIRYAHKTPTQKSLAWQNLGTAVPGEHRHHRPAHFYLRMRGPSLTTFGWTLRG